MLAVRPRPAGNGHRLNSAGGGLHLVRAPRDWISRDTVCVFCTRKRGGEGLERSAREVMSTSPCRCRRLGMFCSHVIPFCFNFIRVHAFFYYQNPT